MKKIITSNLLIFNIIFVFAQAPAGYYDSANGMSNNNLRLALNNIISDHTDITYGGLWNAYRETDSRVEDGILYVWDMYSNCDFTFGAPYQDTGGAAPSECMYYNREHSVPQSWFGGASPMYSDIFHIYPTDKKVNAERSNYPFGEVNNPSYTSANGSKRGNSSFAGYSGIAFEPIDEYKGDFARTYFYMATCYVDKNFTSGEGNIVFTYTNSTCNFTNYAVNLFLKWNRQDPVSQKEIDRNNVIFNNIQGNRNPFIDHPELAEYIWGIYAETGTPWNSSDNIDNIAAIPITIIFNKQNSTVQILCEQTFNSFTVTNLSGQTVSNGNVNENIIQLNPLANGLYLITLNNNLVKITQKLLVF
ncbi:MAG: endonuclease [Paludibacter sp.]|nr:endonuclease [Paludibacter sp.]